MRIYKRTDDNILNMALSFLGAKDNLLLLENCLVKKKIITIHQYSNYLSQVAFCIELGMKTALLNENDIEEIHDLKILYDKMPDVFHEMCEKQIKKKSINAYLTRMCKIYTEFRYMNTKNLVSFLDENNLDKQGYVNFIEVPNNKGFLILRTLLYEVKKIHKTMYGFIDINQLLNIGNDAISKKKIKKIHEELRRIQSSLYVAEKGT